MTNKYQIIACSCSSPAKPLKYAINSLMCEICGNKYPIEKGVLNLIPGSSAYYGEFDESIFNDMLEEVDENGCISTLYKYLVEKKITLGAARYGSDNSRGGFVGIVNASPKHTVLDLGCGWGGVSLTLASFYKKCYSVDITSQRIQYLYKRANELGINNIIPIRSGDSELLPFLDSSLDCVVLNGVLEWIPEYQTGSPKEIQIKLLKEVVRILKPEGILYLAIENRYAAHYLLNPEDHTGLTMTSFMPRFFSDYISRKKRNKPYRTYTYSRSGYNALLKQGGFKQITQYIPIPNYRKFNFLLDSTNKSQMYHYMKNNSSSHWKAKIKTFILPWTSHAFSIISGKQKGKLECPVMTLLELLSINNIIESDMYQYTVSAGSGIGLAISSPHNSVYAKIPLNETQHIGLKNEFRMIGMLSNRTGKISGIQLPKPIIKMDVNGTPAYVQTYVAGDNYLFNQIESPDNIVKFISCMHEFNSNVNIEDKEYFINRILYSLKIYSLKNQLDLGLVREELSKIIDIGWEHKVVSHSDLWTGNIIKTVDNTFAIIDWCDATENGIPLSDLFHFVLYSHSEYKMTRFSSILNAAINGFDDVVRKELLYCFGIFIKNNNVANIGSPDKLTALFILYMLDNLSRRSDRLVNFDTRNSMYELCSNLDINIYAGTISLYKDIALL